MRITLCFALICLFVPCAYGSGIVQGANATAAGTTSVNASFTVLTAAGNLLICGAASSSISDTLSISDSQSNVWNVAVSPYNLDTVHTVEVFYAANIVGGSDTITLTGTAATTHWLGCQEWFQAGSVAHSAIASGTTANPASGAFAQSTNNGMFGFVVNTATPVTAPVNVGTLAPYIMSGAATASMGVEYTIGDQSLSANAQFTAAAGTWTCVGVDLADNSGFVKNPNVKYGIVAYGSKFVNPPYDNLHATNFTGWAHKIFNWIAQSETGSPYPYSANVVNGGYIDSQGMYQNQWYNIRPAGLANAGWDPERFIFHFGSNYQVVTNWPNASTTTSGGEDGFDYLDGGNMFSAVNGALVYNGTAYSDVSSGLYAGTCPAATCTLSNSGYYLYLGYGVPFDRVNFTFTTPMTGGAEAWQYWNGTTWNTLTLATDGTSGLTASGQIIFTPPSDWTQTTVNTGTHTKYWVRLNVGTPTTSPVIKIVKGDDWYADALINFNGTTYTNCSTSGSCGTFNNTMYFGNDSTFATFSPTVGVANVAGTVTWQYWNGSAWTTFTPATDGTVGFTVAGTNTVSVGTLAGWAKVAVTGEYNSMYYVRAQITGQTTAPTITDVDGLMNCRGWCPACNHANTGITGVNADLEYDPNPPANQTAHFRHQARWQSLHQDYGGLNTSDQQGSPALYTYPQAMAGKWNAAFPSGNLLYNGLFADNAGGGFQAANMVTPSSNFYNNVIEMSCYPNCSTSNPPSWNSDMTNAMTALTAVWHNPSSVVYGPQPGTYDSRKTMTTTFNIVGLTAIGSAGGIYRDADYSLVETAMAYAINNGANFDVPTSYMDAFLTANGGGGTCPSGGCNTTGVLGVIEFHDEVAPVYGNFRVIRGSNTYWHTIDTSSIVPMAALAAYKIGENSQTIFDYVPGGTQYYSNDDYYYWPSTTTTLTAPVTASRSDTQTISVANSANCPAIPGNSGELPGGIWMQFGTTTGPGTNGTADIMSLSVTGTNTYKGTSGNGPVNFVNAYPVGTVVRCAVIGHLSWSAPPPMAQMFMYTTYFPAMSFDLGVPNASGWMNGNRDLAFLSGATVSPLGTAGCGASGCPPVERRDFSKAVILFRPIQTNTLDSETQTLSNNISLTNPSQMLNGPYYRLNVDGTIGPAINTVQLRAGEAAILMTQGTLTTPAISSLSPNTGPAGTVVAITGTNFGTTPDTVTFGGIPATPTAWSNTSITVPVPAGAATGQVVVTVTGAQSNPMLFSVTASASSYPFSSFVPPIF